VGLLIFWALAGADLSCWSGRWSVDEILRRGKRSSE
jgi:hypothetical protein